MVHCRAGTGCLRTPGQRRLAARMGHTQFRDARGLAGAQPEASESPLLRRNHNHDVRHRHIQIDVYLAVTVKAHFTCDASIVPDEQSVTKNGLNL